MKKNEKKEEINNTKNEFIKDSSEEVNDNKSCEEINGNSEENKEKSDTQELDKILSQLDEKTKKCDEYVGMLQRMAAEFDNYKKRTLKEKESLYSDTVTEVVAGFLPVVDNLERAIQAVGKDGDSVSADAQVLKDGVELVYRQLQDVMKKLSVEEIKGVGEKFDPQLHNAVMHVDDEEFDENVIIEEFQKGYIIKDKVIRHSMVKVAN